MRANDFYELGDSDFVFLGDDPGGVAAGGAGVAVDAPSRRGLAVFC